MSTFTSFQPTSGSRKILTKNLNTASLNSSWEEKTNKHKSGKQKEHKPKLLGPDIFRLGGGLSRSGGQKVRHVPRIPGKPNFWAGILPGYPGGARKGLRKKGCVRFSSPNRETWRDTSTFGLQPPRGCVPFVPWKCPMCPADTLYNLSGENMKIRSGHPGCVGSHPQTVPGTFPKQTDLQIPLMCSLLLGVLCCGAALF